MDDEAKVLCPIPPRLTLGEVLTFALRQWRDAPHTAGHQPVVCRINPAMLQGLTLVLDSDVKPGHILIEGK